MIKNTFKPAIVTLAFLLATSWTTAQDFSATMTASGDGSSYNMTFGFSPNATDGYDDGIDSYAPPAPPPPAFDAALTWGGDRYYTQILDGDGNLSVHEYGISLAYAADNLITITWDNTGWSDMMSSCVLQDAFGGLLGINIDMTQENSLTLTNPAFNALKLLVTPNDYAPPSNEPPVADAGDDQTVDADATGSATVTLDGSGSSDSDGTIETYNWSENLIGIGSGVNLTVSLDAGIHTIMLTVFDDDGATGIDEVIITVNEFVADPSTVSITSPADGAVLESGDVSVEFLVENLVIPDEGHVHLWVDGTMDGMFYTVDPITVTGLEEGSHTIGLQLVDTGHNAFDPDVLDEVNVTVSAPSAGGDPNFSFDVIIGGDGSTYVMTAGFSPNATDGYDDGIDSYAPPAPPPPAFDAALTWGGDRYYTQILNGSIDDLVEHEYGVSLAFASDNQITITWDNTGWSEMMSSCVLQDAFGGLLGINIDMLSESSLDLTNPAFNSLKLLVTPAAGSDEPDTYPVTFTVVDDGNEYTNVALKGQMTGWANVPMNSDGSGNWTLTLDMEAGSYEWGAVAIFEDSTEAWLSSLAGFESNPVVVVGPDGTVSGDTGFTVPCQTCASEYLVTFQLDNTWGSVPCEGNTWVTGSMDGWSGYGAECIDNDGDGICTATMNLFSNEVAYEYKYTCGGWDNGIEDVPDECAYNTEFHNRGFYLTDGDLVLDSHPWSGCPGDGPPPPSSSSVFITELADPNNASSARFVELFNIGGEDVDLGSGWALQRWTNGNADPQDPVALTGTISAGGFYVISPNGTAFESMYGVEADQDIGTGGAADSNGDDNIALVDPDGNIADMYGRPGEDGTGTDHEFEDGRAERNSDIAGGNATFDPAEWAIDNDGDGGDGPQDAPDGFDPFVWFDHNGLPTGNWGCLDPEALNYDSDSDGCEDGTESCCDYPTLATISEIQGQADASPFAGEYVETSGIVTAVASGAYWIQDGSGAWNGIYVYDATDTLVSVGDDITIVALVTEYYDLTELIDLEEFTVNSSNNTLPDAVSLTTGAVSDEAYESVLVTTGGTSDSEVNNYGEWSIDDGSGPVVLDDMMFAFVPIVGNNYGVWGPLYYGYGAYKIQPRDENDVEGVGASTYSANFSIDMNGSDYPNADYPSVVINGSWNDWGAWGVELSDTDEDGIFEGTLEGLADESAVEFVIAVTGESDGWSGWGVTINAPIGGDCWNGNDEYANYIFTVSGADVDIAYCAGTCDATCAAPPAGDPNFSATISANGGGENYSMTFGFSPDATDGYDDGIDSYAPPAPPPPAFDAALTWGGDRYYAQILNGSIDDLVEHEYGISLAYDSNNLIDLSWDNTGWSDLMSSCVLQDAFGGLLGIDIDMLSETTLTLDNPAFNALILKVTPAAGSDEPDTFPVTFTVVDDGNDYQDVELKGSMTDWATLDMNNDGTGTWTLTFDLEAGSYEWGAIENDGSEWGIWLPSFAGFDSNPTVVVGPDGSVSGDTGFTVPFQGGDEVMVTFNVNMSDEDVSADGVHIAGTMNNWDPAFSPMSDDDGDGVYTASFSLVVGSTAEYKFLNGNAWGTEEIVPEECSLGGFGNRYVEVPDSDLILDAVCFNGCGACDTPPPAGDPNFSFDVNISGDGNTYVMTAGFSPDATDGYDDGLDSYAPPAPPPPAFDAALTWGGDRYYTQILNGSLDDLLEHEYGIALAYASDNLITITWDNTGWSGLMSACVLQDAFGGLLGIDVDMLTETSLTLDNPAFNALLLKVTPAAGSDEPDTAPVFITELADPNNASSARFVELFNIGGEDIDLGSGWALQRWTNGNADPQDPVALTGTIPAGGFYVISPNGTAFESMYGVEADQDIGTGGAADSNGDDNIALVDPDGSIADMYGRPGEDGTGTDHEFEDGRAERNSNIAGGNATFDPSEWAIDNDGDGGDGPQDAPEGFDPFVWFDHNGLPTGNWGCLDPEALNYDSDSDGCEDGTEGCCDYPTLATISEIQGQAEGSPFAGEYVETSGIVTAVASGAYWIQDGSGAWNGIYVYSLTDTLVSVGDDITIVALVTEYYDLTELKDLEELTVNSSGNALPDAVSLATGAVSDEAYESVLVATSGTSDSEVNNYGEWTIDDGSGPVMLDDIMFAFVPTVGNEYAVTGPLYFGYGSYKIEPRDENDVFEPGTGPDFSVSLDATASAGTYTMTVGFSPGATDGYDEDFDIYAPPAPPPPAFDAAIGWDNDRYFNQIVAGTAGDWGAEHVFDVQLQYDTDNLITLTWDNTGWADLGSFHLTDAFDGALGIDIDMTTVNSLTLDNPAFNLLKLKVTPVDQGPPPTGLDFAVSLDVSGEGNMYTMTAGFSPNATDGYDDGIDSFAPPAPPPPAFDAALGWAGDRYYTQILAGLAEDVGVEHVFDIQLQYGTDNLITLTWDNTGWSDLGSFSLTDAFDGVLGIDIDMTVDNSLTLDNPAFNMLKLKVTPAEQEPPPPFVNVTFQVNMAYQDPSNGVYIRGGNIGSSMPDVPSMGFQMSDEDGDLVYDVILELESNSHYTYKFATGESYNWEGNWENVPAECGEGDYLDRYVDTGGGDATLDPVCFGSCEDCATETVDLTFNLDMSDVETSPDGVFLAGGGTFGSPGDNPMSDADGDDVWTITVTLPSNLSTDYTFLNGNCSDWSCKESIGGQDCAVPPYNDRHIDLGEEDVTVNACFAVCGDGFCDDLEPPSTFSANFSIDMNASEYPNADYSSVVINGSWNGWGAWGVELSDTDDDGVFTGTLEGLVDESNVEFVIAATGTADGWSGWGVVINSPLDSECDYVPGDGYANYGFFVNGMDVDVAYCAGTCDASCGAPPGDGNPDFAININVSGEGNMYTMTAGFSPDATDGYDDGIDVYAPPAPPPPAFDAALGWAGDRYYTQILNGSVDDLVEHEYDIQLSYGTDNMIVLEWDNTGWSDVMSSCMLQDAFGGVLGIDIDMLSETSLALDNPAFNALKLKVTPSAPEPPPPSLGFAVSLDVAGEGNIYPLTAGFSPDATDGYDDGTDSYAPPAPPPPAFDAALGWNGDRYYTQILAGNAEDVGVEHVFDIQLQYGTDNLIMLTWDNTGWSDLGAFSLTDAFDGLLGIDVDMTVENSLTLDNPAFNMLKLKVTPEGEAGPSPFDDISLAGGWNLISFDVGIENNGPADVFAALIDAGNLVVVTGYGAGGANFYDPSVPPFLNTLTSIDEGFGYWVKVNNEVTLSAEGVSLGGDFAKDLAAGWNLIGYWLENSQGPADAFAAMIDEGNLVVATGYGAGGANFYDPSVPPFLNTLTSLDNGFGYWVKVNYSWIDFTYPEAGLARQIVSMHQETNPEIVKTNEFMFINGEVNFTGMDYMVGDKVEIRTESGLLVGEMKIAAVTGEMLAEFDDFPGFECSLGDNLLMTAPIYGDDWTTEEIDGAIKGENLRFIYNDIEAELSIEYTGTMELAKVDLEFRFIPEAYALRQNYPNPFNPVTTITYDLADEGFVSLKIYNMLGQEVINLVSADRKAGVHTVQWNGMGHTGHPVSSGVYFYILNTDQFKSVKKMVFMK